MGRISIFRSPDFLPICIPNTVDHRNYRPHIPLLALVYTNTHLLGQGRLGENYSGLIYETPGRAKGRGPRLTRPHFLLSRPLIHVSWLRLSEASPRYLAKYLKTVAVFRLLSQQLWNIWHIQSCIQASKNRVYTFLKISRLWAPHFLCCEGAVICHSGPGRGTIAWAGACPLTPSQRPLIRLTFLQGSDAITPHTLCVLR